MRRKLSPRGALVAPRENRSLSDGEDVQALATKGASGRVDERVATFAFSARNTNGQRMSADNRFSITESLALLHAIFPRYPDLRGMNPAPELDRFLLALRAQSSPKE